MNDYDILSKISGTVVKAPDSILAKIKKETAAQIAEELLMNLNGQMAPCKRESIDRSYTMMNEHLHKQYLRGA